MGGRSSSTVIGYRYFMGMHMVICHGPVDSVSQILVGERLAWSGSVTSTQRININEPDLFGGEKKEGGIQGDVDIDFGDSNQGQNDYLQAQLGTDIPAFRGVLGLVLRQVYVTAMTRYPKPWWVRVRRIPGRDWYPATAEIGSGAANGAHIIYETLTNPDWGLGLPTSRIDDTSFRAAADVLLSESFGLSLEFSRQSTVEDFIVIILTHIAGVLYTSPITGQFILRLIREPTQTELDNAPVLNASNIQSLNRFERPSFAEMINEVVLNYRPRGATRDSTITVQDLASIQAEEAVVTQTVQFPGIDNATIAGRVAQREIRQYSTPLARFNFTINRVGYDLSPGDIVKFSWPEYGVVDLVARVFAVDYGDLQNGQIIIDATEDIYSLPSTSYINTQESLWEDPVTDPVAVPFFKLFELPYYNIENDFDPGDVSAFDQFTTFMQVGAGVPPSASASYQLWRSPDTNINNYEFDLSGVYTPSALITNALTIPTSSTPEVIDLNSITGFLNNIADGTYAFINDEVIVIDTFDSVNSQMTIRRGALDTIPQAHSAGDRVYFMESNSTWSSQLVGNPTDSPSSPSLLEYARLLTQTDIGLLDINSATAGNLGLVSRQTRPFPPSQVQIDGVFFPIARAQLLTEDLVISWKSKNRLLQTIKPLSDFYQGVTEAPESNVTFVLNIYDENDTLIHTENIAGTATDTYSFTYTAAAEQTDSGLTGRLNNSLRIELYATREDTIDGTPTTIESLQRFDHTFDRTGYGYQYGNYYGGGDY